MVQRSISGNDLIKEGGRRFMNKVITVGEKEVNLLANAATPIRYKMVFGEDVMVAFNQITNAKRDSGEILDIVSQLAYIMNAQATMDRDELKKLNRETFIEWLEDFGAMDFVNASEEIINTYLEQSGTDSKSKNAASRPKGK
jgi:hypothetical protein